MGRFLSNEQIEMAHEYMLQWVDNENWTDLNVCLNHTGDTIYAAYLLVNSGAINSSAIREFGAENYKETALESEIIIEELAKRFNRGSKKVQLKHINTNFKNCYIFTCKDCNHVSFVADGNETLYPELKTECWSCHSKNIKTKKSAKVSGRKSDK